MTFRDFAIFNFEFDKDSYCESTQHNKTRIFLLVDLQTLPL